MIMVNELKLLMDKRGYTLDEFAYLLGISPNTLETRLDKGILGSDEIEKMRIILQIENPSQIFFAKSVTC